MQASENLHILALLRRLTSARVDGVVMQASENLHITGHMHHNKNVGCLPNSGRNRAALQAPHEGLPMLP